MSRFLVHRLLQATVLVGLMSFVCYALIGLMPGDPIDLLLSSDPRLTPDDMSALLRSADVMLNSSIADNTPNAILEALASAVPVVSTDAGGIPYLVEHGVNAMLVPVGSDEALANAAIEILMDPGLRATLISNGLREASRFTWENVRESLLSAYDACSVHGSPSVCWPVTRSDRS